ncbi:MAG: cation diffusion facilitator family transporter, partial [Mycobacteriaceae bacterium]
AVVLIMEMQSLLIGEGATPAEESAILHALVGDGIDRVIHCKTQYLGPEEMLVAAKVAVAGTVSGGRLAAAIDAAELRVRTVVPAARVIYLEPDLYRAELHSTEPRHPAEGLESPGQPAAAS